MSGPVTGVVVQRMLEAAGLMPWRLDHPTGWLLGDYGMGFRLTVMREDVDAALAAMPRWTISILAKSEHRVAFYVKPRLRSEQGDLFAAVS